MVSCIMSLTSGSTVKIFILFFFANDVRALTISKSPIFPLSTLFVINESIIILFLSYFK